MDSWRDDRLTSRLVAITALGFLLAMPPLLSLFDHRVLVFGVPLIWAYLFFVWGVIIGLVAAAVARSDRGPE